METSIASNALSTKTKVVFTVNHFDVTPESVHCSEYIIIRSNVWQITVNSDKMCEKTNESMVAISLRLESEERVLSVRFNSFIYDQNMKKKYLSFGESNNFVKDFSAVNYMCNSRQLLAEKEDIFPDKSLIIGVIITIESQAVSECLQNAFSYRNTFNVKDFNDLHIYCGDKEFFVTKAVLSSHSEVFKELFANEMIEQNRNQIIIKDINGEVFEEFLKFIYFGNTDKLDDLKEELIIIADKYQVLNLKEYCSAFMLSEMCATNAINMLITLDKYNCVETGIENPIIEFIANNLYEIKRKTPIKWKELNEGHNQLLVRITESMAQLIKELKDDEEINYSPNRYTFIF